MPIPVWVLLGFAAWTLFILFTTVGVYRWSRILTGRTAIAAWRADEQQGSEMAPSHSMEHDHRSGV